MPPSVPLPFSPLVRRVSEALPGQEMYLVGGAVRDALLGKLSHDLDFTVPAGAIAAARRVANALGGAFYVLDEGFDTARVILKGSNGGTTTRDVLDFSSFRTLKTTGKQATSIEEDLRGRDFTINSMAYDPAAQAILDPTGGGKDLRAKIIRASSAGAIREDAVRILRAVRLAAALDFKIDPGTRDAMKAAAGLLPAISPERLRDELFKTLEARRPDASLRGLEMLGVFPYVMPELEAMKGVQQSEPHVADVWEHTLSVVQYLQHIIEALAPDYEADRNNDLFTGLLSLRLGRYRQQVAVHFAEQLNAERSMRGLLLLAALYHDVSKPATRSVEESGRVRFLGHERAGVEVVTQRGRALRLSNAEVERLRLIIGNHMRFHFHASRLEDEGREPSRKSIYRFFRDTGDAGVDLILLGLADLRGVRGHTLTQETWSAALDVARIFLENYFERPQEAVAPASVIDGNELMNELGLQPGPMIGELLAAIREAQATGDVTSREQALTFAKERANKESRGGTTPPSA
jgi:putative nucleotidyltransferase with HDIG domain